MNQENQIPYAESRLSEIRQNPTKSNTFTDMAAEVTAGCVKRKQKRTIEKKELFLRVFDPIMTIEHSCRVAGIHRDTFYDWRKNDPEFIKRLRLSSSNYVFKLIARSAHEDEKSLMQPYS